MLKNISNKKGFSVLEMIIAMSIFLMIGLAIVSFQLDVFSLNKISGDNLSAQEDLRQTLKVLSSEIRSMTPSDMGAYPIAEAGTSTLIFYTNADSDPQKERVHYFLDGKTLKKGTLKPTGSPLTYTGTETVKELAHNIANGSSAIFSYYDENYDGSSDSLSQPIDLPLVRLIKAELIIDENPLKLPPPLSFTTQVSIRNLKDNL